MTVQILLLRMVMTISLSADGSSASHIILIQRVSAFLIPLHHLQLGWGGGGLGRGEGEFTGLAAARYLTVGYKGRRN